MFKNHKHTVKRVAINILVDSASIVLVTAASSSVGFACLTLYQSYYTHQAILPEAFSSASLQFASVVGLISTIFFVRKYRVKQEGGEKTE